jgi:hypothetical protein
MYQKKNGGVSYRLKSYLLVDTNPTFSLSAYLRDISAELTLPTDEVVPMEVWYTVETQAAYRLNTMMHWIWARGQSEQQTMQDSIGKL